MQGVDCCIFRALHCGWFIFVFELVLEYSIDMGTSGQGHSSAELDPVQGEFTYEGKLKKVYLLQQKQLENNYKATH